MVSAGPGAEQPAHRPKVDKPLADSEIYIKNLSRAAEPADNSVRESVSRPRLEGARLLNSFLAALCPLLLHSALSGTRCVQLIRALQARGRKDWLCTVHGTAGRLCQTDRANRCTARHTDRRPTWLDYGGSRAIWVRTSEATPARPPSRPWTASTVRLCLSSLTQPR